MSRLRTWRAATAKFGFSMAMLTASASPAGCDLNVTVTGVVRDPSGVPLQDVAVTLQTPGREPDRARTTSDGTFNVGIVGADPRKTRVSFHKDGFQDVARDLGEEARPTMEVTLIPN
jgi:hypothetical protein